MSTSAHLPKPLNGAGACFVPAFLLSSGLVHVVLDPLLDFPSLPIISRSDGFDAMGEQARRPRQPRPRQPPPVSDIYG